MIIRKTKFKGKLGGVPLYSQRKHVSTFGTVKRFAPEPGSTQSKTQQKVINSFKNIVKQNGILNYEKMPNTSTGSIQITQSIDSQR